MSYAAGEATIVVGTERSAWMSWPTKFTLYLDYEDCSCRKHPPLDKQKISMLWALEEHKRNTDSCLELETGRRLSGTRKIDVIRSRSSKA